MKIESFFVLPDILLVVCLIGIGLFFLAGYFAFLKKPKGGTNRGFDKPDNTVLNDMGDFVPFKPKWED